MADKKISALTAATTVNAADVTVLVQSGTTLNVPMSTLFGKIPVNANVIEASESKSANGALSTTLAYSKITSVVTTGVAYTLAAGAHGAYKTIVCSAYTSGTAVVTVSSGANFSTITFAASSAAVGQSCTLQNIDGTWYVVAYRGVTIA